MTWSDLDQLATYDAPHEEVMAVIERYGPIADMLRGTADGAVLVGVVDTLRVLATISGERPIHRPG